MRFRVRTTQLGCWASHSPNNILDAVEHVSSEVRETGIKKDEWNRAKTNFRELYVSIHNMVTLHCVDTAFSLFWMNRNSSVSDTNSTPEAKKHNIQLLLHLFLCSYFFLFQGSPYDITSPTDSVIGADFQVISISIQELWDILDNL